MAATQLRGTQVGDGTIQRADLDVSTPGSAVIRKVIAGSGITISNTGADNGTGDVTIVNAVTNSYYGIDTQTASFTLSAADFANGYVRANFTAAGTVTIPPNSSVACPVGFSMPVSWVGGIAGVVSIAPGAGVTLRSTAGQSFTAARLWRPGAIVSITQVAANVWEFVGPTDAISNGTHYRTVGTLDVVSTTTTATSLIPDAVGSGWRYTKAGVAYPGYLEDFGGTGVYSTGATPPPNSQITILINGVVKKTAAVTSILATNATNFNFRMVNAFFQCITSGASGTGLLGGSIDFQIVAAGATDTIDISTPTPFAVDWTVDNYLDVQFQWLAAGTAASYIRVLNAFIAGGN